MSITQIRAERLVDERTRAEQNVDDMRAAAEKDSRDLNELEVEQIDKWRTRIAELDAEIVVLTEDLEREANNKDISKLIRVNEPAPNPVVETGDQGPVTYRTFSAYAVDKLVAEHPRIAAAVAGDRASTEMVVREQAIDRLQRTLQNTLSTDVAGLVPPAHMAQIMDLINTRRPIVSSARNVDLSRGSLTYPVIDGRPTVSKQSTEKTLGGTIKMEVSLATMAADTFIGGGDLSWQTINWSTPDALQLWFDLAAESYAQQTETHAGTTMTGSYANSIGTASPVLGTAGTEDFDDWKGAVLAAVGSLYTNTSGRAQTNTLYLSAGEFFNLAALTTAASVQMSAIGNLDISSMTGTAFGLRVVGSYGFPARTRIVGDSAAFLVGESPGAPVELRAVEPSIGGLEVGLIGAFQAKIFDADRFIKLNVNA